MAESILVVGGNSTIGSAFATQARAQGAAVTITRRKADSENAIPLDLAMPPQAWPLLPSAKVAVLCAAVTKLDNCENDPETTKRINVTHMRALAERLLAQGSYVVFLSTNQVFDGLKPYAEASDPTSPLNEYGRQKAEFEVWLMGQGAPAAVLRLTKVISNPLPLLAKWSESLTQGGTVEAFTDLVFAPLPIAHVLEGLSHLGKHRPRGIFQLSGARDISYYDIATELAKRMNADTSKVVRTSAVKAGVRSQFLPKHGTLRVSREFAFLSQPDPMDVILA